MTKPARITPEMLRHAAEVAKATGVAVSIQAGGRLYTLHPDAHAPNLTDEDAKACDEAFR